MVSIGFTPGMVCLPGDFGVPPILRTPDPTSPGAGPAALWLRGAPRWTATCRSKAGGGDFGAAWIMDGMGSCGEYYVMICNDHICDDDYL